MASHPDLRVELLARAEEDQVHRRRLAELAGPDGVVRAATPQDAELLDGLRRIDEENTAWMKTAVAHHGWPTRAMVGDDGSDAAWLLVQHADRDAAFQRHCLELMEALPAGAVKRSHVAYLTDRVRLAFGQPQVYGTQVEMTNGIARPRNLEHPAGVDARRALMGLGPVADYLASFGAAGPAWTPDCRPSP